MAYVRPAWCLRAHAQVGTRTGCAQQFRRGPMGELPRYSITCLVSRRSSSRQGHGYGDCRSPRGGFPGRIPVNPGPARRRLVSTNRTSRSAQPCEAGVTVRAQCRPSKSPAQGLFCCSRRRQLVRPWQGLTRKRPDPFLGRSRRGPGADSSRKTESLERRGSRPACGEARARRVSWFAAISRMSLTHRDSRSSKNGSRNSRPSFIDATVKKSFLELAFSRPSLLSQGR